MDHWVSKAILKMCGEIIIVTTVVGAIIALIGNGNRWNTAIAYSDAFFIAGALVIAGGLASRLSPSQDMQHFRLLSYTKSFRDMSKSKRVDLIANPNGSTNLVAVSALSGLLLILISELIAKIFQ